MAFNQKKYCHFKVQIWGRPGNCCSVQRLKDQMEVIKTLNGCENINTNICSQDKADGLNDMRLH